ncbi:MAG: hypothetical protein ACREJO_01875 [Phycisphaerales bacterium]
MTTAMESLKQYNWQPQPKAWKLVNELVNGFLARNHWAAAFSRRMKEETGTRFVDWVDHICAPEETVPGGLRAALMAAGFKHEPQPHAPEAYLNRDGLFPPVLVGSVKGNMLVAIKVESVVDFLQAHNLPFHEPESPEGAPLSRLRMGLASREHGTELWGIERHGLWGFDLCDSTPEQRVQAQEHLNRLRTRRRDFVDDTQGFVEANRIVDAAIKDLGADWTCDLFFKAEREYWMKRNRAAQVQFARQQKHGMGWANHDHHTYRSSREHFKELVLLWEKLGFICRECFYAGAEAGWGAQVMEQPVTGITTFNDVDMSPDELMGDFAHQGFKNKHTGLGTVGLWCALHGEAVLQAGMHHLEAMFDWHALVEQLERGGVRTMGPFTTFPYLRQAFTEGERWPVKPERIERLLKYGLITPRQGELFRVEGALGSHLENLERNDGFKGFNQEGVSDIIARTDARRVAEKGAAHHHELAGA